MNQALLEMRVGSPKQHKHAEPAMPEEDRQKQLEEVALCLLEVGMGTDAVCKATSLSGRHVADLRRRVERGGEEDG